jgi:hypothetical protein|tara:strand:+ start:288 stop:542 length:255 start_codon:yes stop_codon:yes gene_type:complete
MRLTDKEKKKPLAMKQVQKIMANPNSIKTQVAVQIVRTKPDNINSQVEEFLKTGGIIKKIHNNQRAVPYWVWSLEDYPVRKYRR